MGRSRRSRSGSRSRKGSTSSNQTGGSAPSKTETLTLDLRPSDKIVIQANDSKAVKNIGIFKSNTTLKLANRLMCAAESGNKEELVEAVYLSQKEFNINYPKKLRSGMNVLHTAARNGHADCVEILIRHGARVDLRCDVNLYSMTPLMLAVYFAEENPDAKTRYFKTIDILMKAGLASFTDSINEVDGLNRTALHWAAIRGFRVTIRHLRKHNPDLNLKDSFGETALHYGIDMSLELGDSYGIELDLLKTLHNFPGCDPNIQNDFSETPLHIICDQGITHKNRSKKRHRYYENEGGRLHVVKNLMEFKADASIRNKFGEKPADSCALKSVLDELDEEVDSQEMIDKIATSKERSAAAANEFREFIIRAKGEEKCYTSYYYASDIPKGFTERAVKYKELQADPFPITYLIDRIKQEFYTVWQTEHESGKFEIPETSAEQMAKIKDTTCRILSKLQEIQKLSDNFVNENWIDQNIGTDSLNATYFPISGMNLIIDMVKKLLNKK